MNDNTYTIFGGYYDIYTAFVDYEKWAEYLKRLSGKDLNKGKILDLGCGCARMMEALSQTLSADFTGVDISEEMLIQASMVISESDINAKLIRADISEFITEEKYDFIYSSFDTVNYLNDMNELERLLENCNYMLEKNGVFTFDLINPECIEKNESFDAEGVHFEIERKTEGSILYTRIAIEDDEESLESFHSQHLFDIKETLETARKTGFDEACAYAFLTENQTLGSADKIQVLLKKY